MIEQIPTGVPKILGFKLSGKLHNADYQTFVPAVEAAVAAEGKVRLLAHFEDFHGWDLHAAWDDLKFGIKHFSDFERIAMVGDRKWEEWMARFCKPFIHAAVRYFDASEAEAAWAWLREGA
jgi:SpoIIAA-like